MLNFNMSFKKKKKNVSHSFVINESKYRASLRGGNPIIVISLLLCSPSPPFVSSAPKRKSEPPPNYEKHHPPDLIVFAVICAAASLLRRLLYRAACNKRRLRGVLEYNLRWHRLSDPPTPPTRPHLVSMPLSG